MTISSGFPRASMKREMMCRRLEFLHQAVASGDIDSIQIVLNDFLMEARSLHDVIENEGKKSVQGFSKWWKVRKARLASDPLMKWAHTARVGDFHHGIPSVEIIGWQIKGCFEYDPEQKSDTKNLMMRDGGMFWISEMGTPNERIERTRIKADDHSFTLRISGLSVAQGAPQTVADIPKLCEEIARRNQELLHEVKVTFSGIGKGEESGGSVG
jgi:hypothetical protein